VSCAKDGRRRCHRREARYFVDGCGICNLVIWRRLVDASAQASGGVTGTSCSHQEGGPPLAQRADNGRQAPAQVSVSTRAPHATGLCPGTTNFCLALPLLITTQVCFRSAASSPGFVVLVRFFLDSLVESTDPFLSAQVPKLPAQYKRDFLVQVGAWTSPHFLSQLLALLETGVDQ
jgi:hypothetical protein